MDFKPLYVVVIIMVIAMYLLFRKESFASEEDSPCPCNRCQCTGTCTPMGTCVSGNPCMKTCPSGTNCWFEPPNPGNGNKPEYHCYPIQSPGGQCNC